MTTARRNGRALLKPLAVLALLASVLAVPAAMASASPPEGPVTIVTAIDFSEVPFSGTFAVTDGAATLGCNGGTFVDFPAFIGGKGFIAKVFTCTDGGTGTFTANFQPVSPVGPCDANGHWNITDATGDFAGLRGEGDFCVDFDPVEPAGVETLTGEVHFH